jgi:hypothetical protein
MIRIPPSDHHDSLETFVLFLFYIVKWSMLDQTMTEVRSKFADLSSDTIDALIEEAAAAQRTRHPAD